MRDAKMEAMGLRPDDHEPPKHKHNRMATDDVVSGDSRCDEPLLTRGSRSWSVSKSVCESETARFFFLDPGQIPEFGSGTYDARGSVLEAVVQPTCRIRSLLLARVSNLRTYTSPESITPAQSPHVCLLGRAYNHPLSDSARTKFPTDDRHRTSL